MRLHDRLRVAGRPIDVITKAREVCRGATARAIECFRGAFRSSHHAVTPRGANARHNRKPSAAPASSAPMNAGTSTGRIPANVSLSERPIAMAGFANEVEEVNQYAPAIHAGTRHAAAFADGEENAIRIRPAVATTSPIHCPMP